MSCRAGEQRRENKINQKGQPSYLGICMSEKHLVQRQDSQQNKHFQKRCGVQKRLRIWNERCFMISVYLAQYDLIPCSLSPSLLKKYACLCPFPDTNLHLKRHAKANPNGHFDSSALIICPTRKSQRSVSPFREYDVVCYTRIKIDSEASGDVQFDPI